MLVSTDAEVARGTDRYTHRHTERLQSGNRQIHSQTHRTITEWEQTDTHTDTQNEDRSNKIVKW